MLEVSSASVSYGNHRALENVSIKVGKGEICVILGANGAGKTTLLNTIAGQVKAGPGTRVTMSGRPVNGLKPHDIVEAGIALVPEGRGIFGELTVAENLSLGAYAKRARAHEDETLARLLSLFPRLGERRSQVVRTMSGGEQQMVAIGRALMSNPDILMLDEPSLGLSPLLCSELFKSLKRIGETGMGILLVEQNARQSLAIADRGYLLENGSIVGEDSAAAMMKDPAVQHAYLGGGSSESVPRNAAKVRPEIAPTAIVGSDIVPRPTGIPTQGPPVANDATALVRSVGDMVARATAIQADYVNGGCARDFAVSIPARSPDGAIPRDLQTIISDMEAAARRARLVRSSDAKLQSSKTGGNTLPAAHTKYMR